VIDLNTLKVLHPHGGEELVPMDSVPHHDSASHDPERRWPFARLFKCTKCDEEVMVVAGEPDSGETGRG
jgi:hypothetical protein